MNRRLTRLVAVAVLLFAALAAPAPGQTAPSVTRDRYLKHAMTHQGDAEAGKKLFLEPQKIACGNCHTIDGSGSKAGPDLFAIGDKFGRDDLIQQVLQPSATIAPGYSTTTVRTKTGDLFQGIVKETSADSIGIMGADAKLVRIKTADIDRQKT
ncbi:MAG: estB 2, partial [Phycisphaerales bacterium]|nr:estB 2 [Phycisphaerales bacterium]